MQKLKVALISSRSRFCEIEANMAHFETLVLKAAGKGARFVGFPELALSSYSLDKNVLTVAQKIPGPVTDELVNLAQKYDVYISMGVPEKSGDNYYISQVVIGPKGYLGKFRKYFPTPAEQKTGFSPGKSFPTFQIDGFRLGINICADGRFPETIHAMKVTNVDFIHHPHGNYLGKGKDADEWTRGKIVYFVPRATYARVYILINCSAGDTLEPSGMESHSSGALVIDPLGQVQKRTAQKTRTEKILITEIIKPLSLMIPRKELDRMRMEIRGEDKVWSD